MKKSLLTGSSIILTALFISGFSSAQNITGNAMDVAPPNTIMKNITSVSYSYPSNSSKDFQLITDEGENAANTIISKLDRNTGKRLVSDDGSGYGFLFDSNVLTKIDANSGNVMVSINNGNKWITLKEYKKQYPDYPDIPYSNAKEFQEWINEQIEKSQNGYWENQGGKGWNW
jgi:hypothetical protein